VSLRRQLLLVSLLLLTLPWVGCQFIREIEGALRQGQQQSLQATAQAVATVLQDRPALLYPQRGREKDSSPAPSLYALPSDETVILDGYDDGWYDSDFGRFVNESGADPLALAYQARLQGERLFLLLRVTDGEVVYHNPGLSPQPNGDRVVLRTRLGHRSQDYVISTAAPGAVRARFASRREPGIDPGRIRGVWQDSLDGYTLELSLPLALTGGRLGVYAVSVGAGSGPVRTAGNTSPLESSAPPWLIYRNPELQGVLQAFGERGTRVQVVDRLGWIVGEPTTVTPSAASGARKTFWLLRLIYRSALRQAPYPARPGPPRFGQLAGAEVEAALAGTEDGRWYTAGGGRSEYSVASPVRMGPQVLGAVLVREGSEQYLSLTDRAFSRLLGYSLLAIGAAALGLLGYASLLSWRIRRLSQAAADAVGDGGEVRDTFPRSRARDEVGELSRRYADMLNQVRRYNEYLRGLSRKLAHELRTPIAVIRGSLDNLDSLHGADTAISGSAESAIYLRRARQGLERLNRILTAMSEASRLEESIRSNPLQPMDLVPVLREVFAAYRELYKKHQLSLDIEPASAYVRGAPDLLVQALDKLMDNAATFAPRGETIAMRLRSRGESWEISVSNRGPALPEALAGRLFEPMVSQREGDEGVHLGLGLHVVRLICDYLGGSARAENNAAGDGVTVTLSLPRDIPL
jgi:dedicated sortase system histidine kinase